MNMFSRDQAARSRICRDVWNEARAEQPATFQLQDVVVPYEFRRIIVVEACFLFYIYSRLLITKSLLQQIGHASKDGTSLHRHYTSGNLSRLSTKLVSP